MPELFQQLSEASERNYKLLEILRRTEYAPAALQQNTQRISDLISQKSDIINEIDRLHQITSDEHENRAKACGNVAKRSVIPGSEKSTESLTAAAQQKERDFMEAWQREREAEERFKEVKHALEVAQSEKPVFERDNKLHKEAQREIDQIYESIFAGPTPEARGEDQLEQQVRRSRATFQECQMRAEKEESAMAALERASSHLNGAVENMRSCHHRAKLGLLGGGRYLESREQQDISNAQVKLMQCNAAIDEARRSQPLIEVLGEVGKIIKMQTEDQC